MRRYIILVLVVVAGTWGARAEGQPTYDRYSSPGGGAAIPPLNSFGEGNANPLRPLGDTTGQGQAQPQPPAADSRSGGPTYPPANHNQPPASAPAATQPRNVAPSSTAGMPAITSSTNPALAEELMEAMLRRPASSKLAGTPVFLRDVVASASSRAEQTARVNAYWDLCSATSDYYLSLHEQAELEKLANSTGGNRPILGAALQKLRIRLETALTAAKASQAQLAALMGRSELAPLPGDRPLCVSYRPKFEANFPNGAPQEATELNRLLPLRYAELLDASANVEQSEQYFNQVIRGSLQNLAAAETEVVKALELLALHRRAFVQIARDYNRRITRYTELAKPGTVGSERLVAMLVKTDKQATARTPAESSQYDNRRSDFTPPPTFRDDDWQPTSETLPPHPGDEGVAPATFDQPSEGQPSGDQPSGDQPSGDQPSGTQPIGGQPLDYPPSDYRPSDFPPGAARGVLQGEESVLGKPVQ
jgi:hypothetical protein